MALTETVRRALSLALATAPGLGAFTAAVGVLGLEGATSLCRHRRPSAAVLRVWRDLGYRVEQLPSADDIRVLVIGVEIRRAMQSVRRHRRVEPVVTIAHRLGHAPADALRGLRLLDAYGAKVAVNFEEFGNLACDGLGVF